MTLISSYCPLCISRCGCFYKVEGGVLTGVLPNPGLRDSQTQKNRWPTITMDMSVWGLAMSSPVPPRR